MNRQFATTSNEQTRADRGADSCRPKDVKDDHNSAIAQDADQALTEDAFMEEQETQRLRRRFGTVRDLGLRPSCYSPLPICHRCRSKGLDVWWNIPSID